MSLIDVNVLLGGYPFREIPHPETGPLARVMEREKIAEAWVGHLPSAWMEDPKAGNAELRTWLAGREPALRFVPTIRPDRTGWEQELGRFAHDGAVAVRAYPPQWGMDAHAKAMDALARACGDRRLPLILTVRFEDLRQRSSKDTAGDLTAAHVRWLARAGTQVRLIVCAAGKELIEETHWGLTPEEQRRVVWDFSWVWGPPEDHLAKLFRSIGSSRFVYGTHWPLRLAQNPRANLDLLPPDLKGARLADPSKLFSTKT